jgi:hypothetical protein
MLTKSTEATILGVLIIAQDTDGKPVLQYTGSKIGNPFALPAAPQVIEQKPVAVEAPVTEAAATVEAPAKPKRKGGRKAKTEAPAATVEAPAPAKTEAPAATTEAPAKPKRKGGRKGQNKLAVWLPLSQCLGVGMYTSDKGSFPVAIHDITESARDGKRFYLGFITKDEKEVKDGKGNKTGRMEKHVYHETGEWYAGESSTKLSNVKLV